MKNFTLDPNNPPKLTAEQEKLLDKGDDMPDNDIPELDDDYFRHAKGIIIKRDHS